MATITNLAFAITAEWNGAAVKAASADFAKLQAQITKMTDKPVVIAVETNAAAAMTQLEALQAAMADRGVVITVEANTAAAQAALDETALAAQNLARAEAELTTATEANAVATAEDEAAQRGFVATSAAASDAAATQAAALQGNVAAQRELAGATAATSATTATSTARAGESAAANTAASASAAGLGAAMDKAGKFSAVAFAIGLGAAINTAADFQQAMTLLVTSAGLPKAAMDDLGNEFLKISTETGTAATDIAAASYKVLSLGWSWQDTAKIMHTTAELAKVDNSDIVTTTQAVVTTMHDYQIAVTRNVDVANALRAAVERSNTTLSDFSEGIGRVEQVASALHIKFTEVYGALASLTEQGIPARSAITLLATTMTHLASSTAGSTAELQALGIDAVKFHQTIASEHGLTEGLTTLQKAITDKLGPDGLVYLQTEMKKAQGNVDTFAASVGQGAPAAIQTSVEAVSKAVGGVRNLSIVLGLTGENLDRFKQNVDYVSAAYDANASAVDGWEVKHQTMNQRLAETGQGFKNLFITIGTQIMPEMFAFFGAVQNGGTWLAEHKIILEALIGVLGVLGVTWVTVKIAMWAATAATHLWTAATKVAEAAAWAFSAAMDANPIGLAIIALAAIVGGLVAFFTKTEEGRRAWASFMDFFNASFNGVENFKNTLATIGGVFLDLWNSAEPFRKLLGDMFGPVWAATVEEVKKTFADIKTKFDSSIKPAFEGLMATMGPLWESVKPILIALGAAFLIIVKIVWEMFNGAIRPVFAFMVDLITNVINLIKGIVEVVTGLFSIITGVVQSIFGAFEMIWGLLKGIFTGDFSTFTAGWRNFWNGLAKIVVDGLGNVLSGVWHIIGSLWDTVYSIFDRGMQLIGGLLQPFADMIVAAWNWVADGVMSVLTPFWDWIVGVFHGILDGVVVVWQGLWAGIGVLAQAGLAFVQAMWEPAWLTIRAVAWIVWLGLKAGWEMLWTAISAVWDLFGPPLMAAWSFLWGVVKTVAADIWDFLTWAWDGFVRGVRAVWDAISGPLTDAWNVVWFAIRDFGAEIWNWLRDRWDEFTRDIRLIWEGFSVVFGNIWNGFWDWLLGVASGIWERLKTGWQNLADGVRSVFETLRDDIRGIWDTLVTIFKTPVNVVIKLWNDHVSGNFGLPHIEELAEGGPVRGAGGPTEDNIPIWASVDEHMWTAEEVRAAGGHNEVRRLRAQVLARHGRPSEDNTFAGGGAIERLKAATDMAQSKGDGRAYVYGGSGPEGFDCSGYMSAIYNVLQGANDWWARAFSTESDFGALGFQNGLGAGFAVGVHNGGGGPMSHMAGTLDGVNVESGGGHNSTMYGRSAAGADSGQFEHQYWLPIIEGAFVSGGPGGSDTGGFIQHALSNLFKRLTDPILGEIPDPFGALGFTMSEPLGGLPKGAATKWRDGIYDKLRGVEPATGGGGSGVIPTGEQLDLINRALAITSTPPPNSAEAWQRGLNTLITRESAWNTGAINNWDSNAAAGTPSKGLMQLIDPTFRANHVAGTSDDIYDPLANVAAGIAYIKNRYGDIANVAQADANASPQGYMAGTMNARAGWSIVGENGPEAINFRGGETVYSFDSIVAKLRDNATGVTADLATKLATEIKTLGDRMQNQSELVKSAIEDAIERALTEAGVNMPISISGHSPEEIMASLQAQLFPRLEMMLKQQVGAL